MFACDLQSLGLIDFRNQEVSRPVLHEHLVSVLILVKFDTFVEDLYLILRIQMIVHHHLAAASNKRPAEFYR